MENIEFWYAKYSNIGHKAQKRYANFYCWNLIEFILWKKLNRGI